ncbi:MAG: hypothetical protein ABI678_07870 [Kofleriaceae bacterium]
MVDLAKENAILEAQRAYFASDEHILDRATDYRDMTPEECLVEVAELCESAMFFLNMKSDEELERIFDDSPLPADTVAFLEKLQREIR